MGWCAECAIKHNEKKLGQGLEPDEIIMARIEFFKLKILKKEVQ